MRVKLRYYDRLYRGEKIPRKAKKAILGTIPTRKALKERISKTVIETHNPFNNTYTYQYPDDDFCPYCGCELCRSTGNLVSYPEEYEKRYCLRCGALVSYSDNGYVWHALMSFKEGLK